MIDTTSIKRIIISRTDSIGDVVLTLPLAGILKKAIPGVQIFFLGRTYTKAVIQCCQHIDRFLDWNEISGMDENEQRKFIRELDADLIIHVFPNRAIARLAKSSGIPARIGTSHRLFHWLTCNYRPSFSRSNSGLHEAQLNVKLLSPLGIRQTYSLSELDSYSGFINRYDLPAKLRGLLDASKVKIVLHPKSKGSAREWSLDNFTKLIDLLPPEKFQLFVSGTADEGILLAEFLKRNKTKVTDLTGQLSLEEFVAFIDACDGLIAASTGPLHIASALGKKAIGIYPPMRPIHPGRWSPIGQNSIALSVEKNCSECRKSGRCHCMNKIAPDNICKILMS